MSRLDDELKKAFRRVPPPADFTSRLLERIAQQPAPKPRWWQRLAMFIEPPKLRWVAIGVTASLLLAIGAIQFSNMRRVPTEDKSLIAQTGTSEKSEEKAANTPDNSHLAAGAVTPTQVPQSIKRTVSSTTSHRPVMSRSQRAELRAEGEAAKEKLMLALSIASSALSEAQKAVHDDGGLNP